MKNKERGKTCKNLQLYIGENLGAKVPVRINYMLKQKYIDPYLITVGVDSAKDPYYGASEEFKATHENMAIAGIDCYSILTSDRTSEESMAIRKKLLNEQGYDYNPLTGEVEFIGFSDDNISYSEECVIKR